MIEDVVTTGAMRVSANSLGYSLPLVMPWTQFYDMLKPGEFINSPLLAWVAPDLFRYLVPTDPSQRFRFRRHDGYEICPGAMDTDGGSIPLILGAVPEFSRWGFAPAYLIHDWLYIAHKCGFSPDDEWTFEATAIIMAEAMKTLIECDRPALPGKQPNDYNPRMGSAVRSLWMMYKVLVSPVARAVWDDMSTATCYREGDLGYSVDLKQNRS